jgi:hypothetical protein
MSTLTGYYICDDFCEIFDKNNVIVSSNVDRTIVSWNMWRKFTISNYQKGDLVKINVKNADGVGGFIGVFTYNGINYVTKVGEYFKTSTGGNVYDVSSTPYTYTTTTGGSATITNKEFGPFYGSDTYIKNVDGFPTVTDINSCKTAGIQYIWPVQDVLTKNINPQDPYLQMVFSIPKIDSTTTSTTSKWVIVLIVLFVILLLIGIIVGFYYYNKKNSSQSSPSQSSPSQSSPSLITQSITSASS